MMGNRIKIFWALGITLIPLFLLSSLSIGALSLSFSDTLLSFLSVDDPTRHFILQEVRLPRVMAAFLAGGAFALSGCLLQGLTFNPLACPSLLGINQGASFAMILFLLCVPFAVPYQMMLVAFLGGIVAALLTYFIARDEVLSPLRLAIVGITVNGLFFGLAHSLLLLFPERAQMLIFNINGSVAGVSWPQVYIILPALFIGVSMSFYYGAFLNMLRLGEERVKSLGIAVKKHQTVILMLAVLLACSGVSVAGPITFLGLLIPHFLRHFIGEDYQQLLPLSFLYGGLFLVFTDMMLRLSNPISETPIGIVVAILGAPLLMHIAYRKNHLS